MPAQGDQGGRVAPEYARETSLGLEPGTLSLLGREPVVDGVDRVGCVDPSIPLGAHPDQDPLMRLPSEYDADPLLFESHGRSPQRTIRGVSRLVEMGWHEDAEGDGHAVPLTGRVRGSVVVSVSGR